MKHFGKVICFLTGITMMLLAISGTNSTKTYAAAPYADDGDRSSIDELWLELMKEADGGDYAIGDGFGEEEPLDNLYMMDGSEVTDGEYYCEELLIIKQIYWDEAETVEDNICYYLVAFEDMYCDLYYCVLPLERGSEIQTAFEETVVDGVSDGLFIEGCFYVANTQNLEPSVLWMNEDKILDEHWEELNEFLLEKYDTINEIYITSWYLYGHDLSALDYGYYDEDEQWNEDVEQWNEDVEQWNEDVEQWNEDDERWDDQFVWENEYEEPVTDYLWGATLLIGGCIGVTWVRQKNRDRKKLETERRSVPSKPSVAPAKKQPAQSKPVQPKPQTTTAQPNVARPKQTNQALTEEWNGRIYRTDAFYENEDAQRAAMEEAGRKETQQKKAAGSTESKLERYRREQKERAAQEDSLLNFLEGYNAYSDFTFSEDVEEEE